MSHRRISIACVTHLTRIPVSQLACSIQYFYLAKSAKNAKMSWKINAMTSLRFQRLCES